MKKLIETFELTHKRITMAYHKWNDGTYSLSIIDDADYAITTVAIGSKKYNDDWFLTVK